MKIDPSRYEDLFRTEGGEHLARLNRELLRLEQLNAMRVVAVTDFAALGYDVLLAIGIEVEGRPAQDVAEDLAKLPDAGKNKSSSHVRVPGERHLSRGREDSDVARVPTLRWEHERALGDTQAAG